MPTPHCTATDSLCSNKDLNCYKGYQLQYNVEMLLQSVMDSVGQHAVVDSFY